MDKVNGPEPAKSPQLVLTLDLHTYHVNLQFNPDEYPSWEKVIATLNTAIDQAKFLMNAQKMMQMQAQSQEVSHSQRLANRIFKGR